MAPVHSMVRFLLVVSIAFAHAHVLAGQEAVLDGTLEEADRLYFAGEPEAALEVLERLLAVDSTDYDALWRVARAAVVAALEREDHREQNGWLNPAIEHASRAVTERPEGIEARYWRGVAAGHRAMNAGAGRSVELAQVVYEDAHTILEADSLHAGAHNMLGKLNFEIMNLSRIKRMIARTFMSNDALDDTGWDQAEYHLAWAAEASPERVLFQFDLAELRRKRGPNEEAIRLYERVLELPLREPIDAALQARARQRLQRF